MARSEPTAAHLVRGIKKFYDPKTQPGDPGVVDPRRLSGHERKMVVQFLRIETNMTVQKIAEFIRRSPRQVINISNEVYGHAQQRLAPYETRKVADWATQQYLEIKERARAKGDGWLELKTLDSLIEKLGRMGLIYFKGDPVNVHIGDKTEHHHTINAQITDLPADPAARRGAIAQAMADIELLQGVLNRAGGGA